MRYDRFSRREFVATGVGMAAGAWTLDRLAGPAHAGPAAPQHGSNRGVIYKAVKDAGRGDRQAIVKSLTELKELGFDGVEGVSPGVSDKAGFIDAMREVGLYAHGVVDMVHWDKRLSSPDEADRNAGREALENAIRDAKLFGGSSVLLVPGKVDGASETHDDVWHRSIAEIRKVIPLASRLGIHVLVETVWNGFCYDPEQFRDYIDEINSPWVAAYFDIGNMQKFAPAHEWIRTLGRRIVKLDVKDWGVKPGFCRLGEGDVDWDKVRDALREIGFSGWATREGSDGGHAVTARLMNELLDL